MLFTSLRYGLFTAKTAKKKKKKDDKSSSEGKLGRLSLIFARVARLPPRGFNFIFC